MFRGPRRRFDRLALLIPALFLAGFGWFTYATVQREKLRRPLIDAIQRGDVAAVRTLLARGADPNTRDRPEQAFRLLEFLKAVFGRGTRAKDETYNTALMLAAGGGHTDIVRYLLDKGADINAKGPAGTTALLDAASHAPVKVVQLLLDRGANINARNDDGETALLVAVKEGAAAKTVQLLLDRGADTGVKDKDGRTAIYYAAALDKTYLCEELLQHGADVNTRDEDGDTLLMRAVNYNKRDIVRLLLDKGADPNVTNRGRTALLNAFHLADTDRYDYEDIGAPTDRTSREMVKLLLAGGADANTTDEEGYPLLRLAIYAGRRDIVRLLLDKGGDGHIFTFHASRSK